MTLSQSDVLKLAFQVVEQDTGNGVKPHQTFLRFFDQKTGEEGIQPVRVTPGGKAKFELVRFYIFRSLLSTKKTFAEHGETPVIPTPNY